MTITSTTIEVKWSFEGRSTSILHFSPWGMRNFIYKKQTLAVTYASFEVLPAQVKETLGNFYNNFPHDISPKLSTMKCLLCLQRRYRLFYKNVLYKNVESEICRKYLNVLRMFQGSYSNQHQNIFVNLYK